MTTIDARRDHGAAKAWLRKARMTGFLFFLVKGTLWLIVPAVYLLLG